MKGQLPEHPMQDHAERVEIGAVVDGPFIRPVCSGDTYAQRPSAIGLPNTKAPPSREAALQRSAISTFSPSGETRTFKGRRSP